MADGADEKKIVDISSHDKCILNRVFNPNLPNDESADDVPQQADEVILLTDAEKEGKR